MRQVQPRTDNMQEVLAVAGRERLGKRARFEAKMAIFGAKTGQNRLKTGEKMPVLRAVPFSVIAYKLFIL
jgi:hypothetical protein